MDNKAKDGQVINFNAAREAKVEEKRRKYERVLFKNILGVYCVAQGEGLKAVELVDISAEGLSFQLPITSRNIQSIKQGHEMIFRLYFSQDTFIPVALKIVNARECIENGCTYTRFGCTIDSTLTSYDTYKTFVEFLTKYAETAQTDSGDMKLFYF